jgi:glycosyltransferase involved in cell wall biosynthesis
MPTISVVLPVRNGAKWLGEALASVVGQSRPPDEIIVVDGQSEDDSAAIAARFAGVRVIRQPDLGLAAGLNLGFAAVRGDYLTLISSDDLWRAGKLALQEDLLVRQPEVDVVFGRVRFFVAAGDVPPPSIRPGLLEGSHPGHLLEVMMARREVMQRIGPFRPDLAVAMDVDWFARLAEAGARKAMPDQVLVDKRLHAGALSALSERTNPELLTALRAAIARRRAAPGDR